jgi:hypothetical protein
LQQQQYEGQYFEHNGESHRQSEANNYIKPRIKHMSKNQIGFVEKEVAILHLLLVEIKKHYYKKIFGKID